ncbi:MAG: hypothetical protein ABF289_16180 [Clostridiales bacterium]
MEYSKKEKKIFRELVNIAYERELKLELEKLEKNFIRLKNNEIGAFDLDNIIHKFHNGTSRNLYKKYNVSFNGGLVEMAIAHSLRNGVLKRDEIDETLIERIDELIKIFYS